MYEFAANKQKLLRSIAFVNADTSSQNLTDEVKEKMVKEYYQQIGGLMNVEDTQTSGISDQLKCDQCDFIARKEAGLKIHKGKEHKHEEPLTLDELSDSEAVKEQEN